MVAPAHAYEPNSLAGGGRSRMFADTRAFRFLAGGDWLRVSNARLEGGLRVSTVESSGHEIELGESEYATILAPVRGAIEARVARRSYAARPGAALLFPPNERVTQVTPDEDGRFCAAVLLAPIAKLRRALEAEGRRVDLTDGLAAPCAEDMADYIAYLVRALESVGPGRRKAAAVAEAALLDAATGLVIGAPPAGFPPAPLGRVREAEEVMRARHEEPLSVAEIARAVGVGRRSLELAFHAARGHGPRAALNAIRLDAARLRLRAGPGAGAATVTEIALECGFAHLGRFAGAYRARFGESPVETLRRRRAA